MSKFRSRLFLYLVITNIAIFACLGVVLGSMLQSYFEDIIQKRLFNELDLIERSIEVGNDWMTIEESLNMLAEKLELRITVMNSNNQTIYDNGIYSEVERQQLKDVIDTWKNENFSARFFNKQEHAYFGGETVTTKLGSNLKLLVSLYDPDVVGFNKVIWSVLGSVLCIAFFLIMFIAYQIAVRLTKPIDSAIKVARELTKGNYRARTYESVDTHTNQLSKAINTLAEHLQVMVTEQDSQRGKLQTLVENMGSALMLIDERGYVTLVNRTYSEFFHVEQKDVLNELYYDIIPYREIKGIIEEIFMTEELVRKQVRLAISISMRYFEVYGAPIIGAQDEWKGIVLVFHDISETKRLELMRKDFLVNMSHELKTPITSIRGFSETLLDGAMKDEKLLTDFLSIIHKESDRMYELIQDLLELSKIEQTNFELNIGMVNVSETIEEIVLMLQNNAQNKKQTVQATIPEDVYVMGDSHRIKQVFINIINNAIIYTPENGRIHVDVEDGDEEIYVTIADTGIGIKEKEIPRVFERFYRVDKARSRHSGGTGLGLAIVKHLVDAHHGKIDVKSKVNEGTTFFITLPKVQKLVNPDS